MKKISMKLLCTGLILTCGLTLSGCGQKSTSSTTKAQVTAKKHYTIANVPKLVGIPWFNRMKVGLDKFKTDTGDDVFQTGPSKADAALQIQSLEDVITQKVDAITVIPNSPESLEPVLKKAMASGIIVVSHESSGQKNVNYDVEAFDNAQYGAHLMDNLAKFMGEKGEYAILVGSLSATTHIEWANAEVARQKEKYPNMKLATSYVETNEDQQVGYQKTKELLQTYPNLKGIIGSAATDPAAAGMAIEEVGLKGKIAVVGTGLVSLTSKYLTSGSVTQISFWDPADAGYIMCKVASIVLDGKKITNGMDLGIAGYHHITLKGKVIYGNAWVDVTKKNMSQYNF